MPLQFHIEPFTWILLGLLIVLGLLMLRKEWTNREGKWLFFRVLSIFVLILSLGLILLRPTLGKEVSGRNLLIITSLADSASVAQWKKENPGQEVLYLEGDNAYQSINELHGKGIDTLIWAGLGPSEEDRELLRDFPSRWLNASLKRPENYLDSLQMDNEISINEVFEFNASFYSHSNEYSIVYQGFTGYSDSVKLKKGFNEIRFEEMPKQGGKFVAKLMLKIPNVPMKEVLEIPVLVKEPEQFSILMLSSYPQFENRYLKEWLAHQGHELVQRTAISEGKFRDEFYNTSMRSIPSSKVGFYQKFDFILVDALWLSKLGNSESRQLMTSLTETKQSLLISPEPSVSALIGLHKDLIFTDNHVPKNISFIDQSGIKNTISTTLKHLKSGKPIMESATDLGAWLKLGEGKVASIHFSDSYKWLLQGRKESYAELWTSIFSSLGAQEGVVEWNLKTAWPRVGENVYTSLISKIAVKDLTIVPKEPTRQIFQDEHFPEKFQIQIKPGQKGWHQIFLNADTLSAFHFFVNESNEFHYFKSADLLKENLYFFNRQSHDLWNKKIHMEQEKLSMWPFFALFLLSAGFLWIEPRI